MLEEGLMQLNKMLESKEKAEPQKQNSTDQNNKKKPNITSRTYQNKMT